MSWRADGTHRIFFVTARLGWRRAIRTSEEELALEAQLKISLLSILGIKLDIDSEEQGIVEITCLLAEEEKGKCGFTT